MPEEALKEIPIDTVDMKEFKKARAAGEVVVQRSSTTEEVEEKNEESDEKPADEKPKGKGGFQKRIDRLIKHTATLEEELSAAKKQLAEKSNGNGKVEEKSASKEDGEPQRDQFQTDAEYIRALTRWEVKQEKAEEDRKFHEDEKKEIIAAYNKRAIEAQARHDDWQEVVGKNDEPIPSLVGQVIFEDMENGPEVAYYLGKHPEVCKEMMEVTKSKAVAMAWRISEEIAGENKESEEEEAPEEKEEEKPKPASKAPAPIRPVSGGTTKSSVPLDKMDMAAYKKARSAGRVQ